LLLNLYMNSSEQFHEHLRAGRLSAAISLVVGQIVELNITTNATPGSLNTKVDLLSGQITSTVDPAFVSDKAYQRLLDFHTNQINAASQIVREQLRSLQDLLHTLNTEKNSVELVVPASISEPEETEMAPLVPETIESNKTSGILPVNVPELPVLDAAETASKTTIPVVTVETVAAIPTPEVAPITPESKSPGVRAGIAVGLAAVLAKAGDPHPANAMTIPNKFDQALKFAGIRKEAAEAHPFSPGNAPHSPVSSPEIPDRELIDLLSESGEDWDEWLLEEDNILSELSEAGDQMTKNKLAAREKDSKIENNFTGRPPAEWDEFLPEYDATVNKNQANVERFRQNLVNDPQLMSELLAELDDIELLDEGKTQSKPNP
jgi:hypothetical protein